jgi:DEAD/DEAH box helicase domain-containing protein
MGDTDQASVGLKQGGSSAARKVARIRLSPSYWTHDFAVPFSDDVQPASLFLKNRHYLIVDVETKKIADDVGGWAHIDKLGISAACAYDSKTDQFLSYTEDQLPELIALCKERLVVGYNIVGFDLKVLAPYGIDPRKVDVFDIMLDVQNTSGRQFLKLDLIARGTLGSTKSADGLQAVQWYKEGKIDKIIEYCLKDVEITRDVFVYGMKHGHIKIAKSDGSADVVAVQWN